MVGLLAGKGAAAGVLTACGKAAADRTLRVSENGLALGD
jgi:hypothetical protein